MEWPLISVVITAYNYASVLANAVDSACEQNYPNVEVLVLDNASTDHTVEVMQRYAQHPRVRYIRHPENIGMTPNHNRGIQEAKGEYLSILSADDILMPGFLLRAYEYLRAHTTVDIVYGSAYFLNQQGRFVGVRNMIGQPLAAYNGGRNEFASLLSEGCYICMPTMLIKKAIFEAHGDFDESLTAGDLDLVLRWAAAGIRFGYIPEPFAGVRLHQNQRSGFDRYVASGDDIRDTLYLLNRFLVEEHRPKIRGFEKNIERFVYSKCYDAEQLAKPEGLDIHTQRDHVINILKKFRTVNAALPREPFITVLVPVPASGNIAQLETSLNSLISQTYEKWEALVLYQPGIAFESLCRHLDKKGRVKAVALTQSLLDGQAYNTGMRIAGGSYFSILRAGNVYPWDHLEKLVQAFQNDTTTNILLSSTKLLFTDPNGESFHSVEGYPQPEHSLSYLVAPCMPIEALAFSRSAVDGTAGFHEAFPVLSDWEMMIRLRRSCRTEIIASSIGVHMLVGEAHPYIDNPNFIRAVQKIYLDHRIEDPDIHAEREKYFLGIQEILAHGQQLISSPEMLVYFYRALSGRLFRPEATSVGELSVA